MSAAPEGGRIQFSLPELEVLATAVGVLLTLDSAVLVDPEAQTMAEAEILERYGVSGLARADRALAAARARLPVLRGLAEKLRGLGATDADR